jgi:Protein of unknown function (DUF2852)
MLWSTHWSAPWIVFASMMLILFPAIFVAVVLVTRRGMSDLSMACCGWGFRPGKQQQGDGTQEGTSRRESTGRTAFDAYRAETLRRLEREQIEFESFLDHLRGARDKAEFDAFMQARKAGPSVGAPAPQA